MASIERRGLDDKCRDEKGRAVGFGAEPSKCETLACGGGLPARKAAFEWKSIKSIATILLSITPYASARTRTVSAKEEGAQE